MISKHISYNEKNIAEYAKKNKIYKESKKSGLQSSSKELDLEKAFSQILTLSKGSISSLNVIRPREKTDSEKKLAKEASELEKIRWDVKGPKDFGLKASSRQSFTDFKNCLAQYLAQQKTHIYFIIFYIVFVINYQLIIR